jgi:2-dehydropantoate 2-reductase
MSITIVGAGAIGGTVGAYLAKNGEDVRLVDIAKEHVDAINDRGLKIYGMKGEFTVRAPALTPDQLSGPLEWILLAVKAHHTEGAVRQLLPHMNEGSVIVSLQNGLNERKISALVGSDRTIAAHVNWGSDYHGPGLIWQGGDGAFYIGELDGSVTDRLRWLHSRLCKFTETIVTQNIWGFKWAKQCLASMSFATALVDADVADIFESERNRQIMVALLAESVRIPVSDGVTLEAFDGYNPGLMLPSSAEELRAATDSLAEMGRHYWQQDKRRTGVWRDLAVRKRKTEIDARVGELIEMGREKGFEMPLNEALLRMIKEIEDGKREMSWQNLDEFARIMEEKKVFAF